MVTGAQPLKIDGGGVISQTTQARGARQVPERALSNGKCYCGCLVPPSVLRPARGDFGTAWAAFLAWLKSNGHALRGGNLDLCAADAALAELGGQPLVD
jgi:hypothetical protein